MLRVGSPPCDELCIERSSITGRGQHCEFAMAALAEPQICTVLREFSRRYACGVSASLDGASPEMGSRRIDIKTA
jgi:hypothetical protein